MKKILTIILLIPSLHYGQILMGTVKDSITNQSLQLANITFLKSNSGTNTDTNGNYVLNIKQHIEDSIMVSYVGYKSKYFSVQNLNAQNKSFINFTLVRDENILDEVIISQNKIKYNKEYKLSENRDGDIAMFSLIGHETACLIGNPKNELGRIKSVKLYIRRNKDADFVAKFRIKIYSYNKKENKPGDNILAEDLIVSPKNKTYQYIINLEDMKIPFLEDGVCVGIEMVDENNFSKKGNKIGPGVRFTYGENKQMTWYNYRNKGWAKNDLQSRKNKAMSNLMLSMNVLMRN